VNAIDVTRREYCAARISSRAASIESLANAAPSANYDDNLVFTDASHRCSRHRLAPLAERQDGKEYYQL
jgi:hypothetical protein